MKTFMGRAHVDPDGTVRVEPIGARCAVNDCNKLSVGLFAWPDKHTRVELCQSHKELLMAEIVKDAGG